MDESNVSFWCRIFVLSVEILENTKFQLMDGAYGGGRVGESFDPVLYVYKPRTWIR